MSLIHPLIIFLILCIFNSCKPVKPDLYEFDPRILEANKITLSEIADEINYLRLEDSVLLDNVFTIIVTNNLIYLNSRNIGIIEFNREGKFIRKIGNIGNGPEEYLQYLSFCVDDKSGTVYINDRRCKVFSSSGRYVRDMKLNVSGDYIEDIKYFNSRLFVKYGIQFKNNEYEWIIYDSLGNMIKKQKRHLSPFTTNYGSNVTSSYIFDDKLSYFNKWTDTIYSILPDLTEEPSFIISPGEHRFPKNNITIEQYVNNKYLSISRILETSRFYIIEYFYRNSYLALFDKKSQNTYLTELYNNNSGDNLNKGIENDLDSGLGFFPINYFVQNEREYLVGLLSPLKIKSYISSKEFKSAIPKFPEKKKDLERLANSLKETDNPVLMIVRLKK